MHDSSRIWRLSISTTLRTPCCSPTSCTPTTSCSPQGLQVEKFLAPRSQLQRGRDHVSSPCCKPADSRPSLSCRLTKVMAATAPSACSATCCCCSPPTCSPSSSRSLQGRPARAGVLDDLLLNECALNPPQLDVEELLDEELLDVEELQSDEELQEAGVVLSSTARPVCPCR